MVCEERLNERLHKNGDELCEDVRDAAKEAGYTKKELKEARKKLGVKTFHQFDEDGATEKWFWYFPGGRIC